MRDLGRRQCPLVVAVPREAKRSSHALVGVLGAVRQPQRGCEPRRDQCLISVGGLGPCGRQHRLGASTFPAQVQQRTEAPRERSGKIAIPIGVQHTLERGGCAHPVPELPPGVGHHGLELRTRPGPAPREHRDPVGGAGDHQPMTATSEERFEFVVTVVDKALEREIEPVGAFPPLRCRPTGRARLICVEHVTCSVNQHRRDPQRCTIATD